jgi:hypothetical protein
MELGKPAARRIDDLVALLGRIQALRDPSPRLLRRFRGQYDELRGEEKNAFFDRLIREMETRREDIQEPLAAVLQATGADPTEWSRILTGLRRSMESPRLRAFRRFLNSPGGLGFLLGLRADVLLAQRDSALDLEPLDEELAHLFDTWFQQGFLFLQEITQESPYRQIRFLKEHEMVHPMAKLEEMGSRLGEDRRCFALYHRTMPEEPVVFVEVALTRGVARSIHEILLADGDRPRAGGRPDTAIFYSINNTQTGLAGLGLGKVLIFQVVDAIQKDDHRIKTFATLSPIPGLWGRYLRPILEGHDEPFALKRARLGEFFPEKARQQLIERGGGRRPGETSDFPSALAQVLSEPGWIDDPACVRLLQKPLTEIAYFYLTREKNSLGQLRDPVANFHVSNGARVDARNVNFRANRSERGLRESCGMMVNYVYSTSWLGGIQRTMRSLLPWKAR